MKRAFIFLLLIPLSFLHGACTEKTSNNCSCTLMKNYMSNKEAICNDYSRAAFYIGPQSSKKWIVFFESGGFCSSFEECNKRYMNENSTVLMTSTLLPKVVIGRDILSSCKSENPIFYDYTHVLVPYCSSDLWLGLKTNLKTRFQFVDDSSVDNFSFRGHTIFRSVFDDLSQRYNLSNAEEIIIAGSSAGGIGVLNHADWVLNHVIKSQGSNANLKSIIDSGWFINFEDILQARVRPKFMSFANISLFPCQDLSSGYPCCSSASCMIRRGYFPASIRLLVISSMYDIYSFRDVLRRQENKENTTEDEFADNLSLVNMYGGAVNESLTLVANKASNVSIFTPACFQHIYFSTSSLLDAEGGILPRLAEITWGRGKLSFKVQSDTWSTIKIQMGSNSSSLKDFIATWMGQSRGSSLALVDSCVGAQCNPTCPGELLFVNPGLVWGPTAQTIILSLSLVITFASLGLKIMFMLYNYLLKRKQMQYLIKTQKGLTDKELPECELHERVTVACLFLSYSISTTNKTVKRDKGNKESKVNRNGTNSKSTSTSRRSDSSNMGPRSLTVDNYGFDTSVEEGLVSGPQNGVHNISSGSKNNVQFQNGYTQSNRNKNSGDRERKRNCALNNRNKSLENDCVGKEEAVPRAKKVLKNVSVYFNPGNLIAIMGPSGCGKTTLLDLLTGRRKYGHKEGNVYINGINIDRVQDWYSRRIGYVLQLAVPYYEELTVRQNLLFAAHMRLPKKMNLEGKFERVEQVLAETGLASVADAVVGGSVGRGISGGQKRRLCVALQLIHLPSALFLDEPTSGLDASSSLELLNHLNLVAESGRLVIVTIHQPRLEIFHLFRKILLLCDGQVAFYGDPAEATNVFLRAYVQSTTESFRHSRDAPHIDATNPADTIMDLLNCPVARCAILDYYQTSGEPQAAQDAIRRSECERGSKMVIFSGTSSKKNNTDGAGIFNRIFVLEARTSERQTFGQAYYFPFIFFMFGIMTGTVYFRAEERDGKLLMSAYCFYCCANPLFLSSVLMAQLNKALNIFQLERSDGCSRSYENVIQTYLRSSAACVLPVIMCSVMSYFMVMTAYDLWKLVLLTIISLVANQAWIAVYIMVICAQPQIAHRICPMVSAIGGFAGGFLVPMPLMPSGYNLLFYINPQFYGYAAISKVLMENNSLKCTYESPLNCVSTDGNAVLAGFGFDRVNIHENLAIMLGITVFSLLLAWFFLEIKGINLNCFSTKSPTYSRDNKKLKISNGIPLEGPRTSTLQDATTNEGSPTLETHSGLTEDQKNEQKWRKSPRVERWQRTQERAEQRRKSIKESFSRAARLQEEKPRSEIFPPLVSSPGRLESRARSNAAKIPCIKGVLGPSSEDTRLQDMAPHKSNDQCDLENKVRGEANSSSLMSSTDVDSEINTADFSANETDVTRKDKEETKGCEETQF